MERDLDAVVAARERLVDGVVDDLVDEVVEAPETGRADVHARPEPDRLEPLQNRDVLCGVGRLGHEKSPANPAFAGRESVSERAVGRSPREARANCPRDRSRSSSSSIAAAQRAAVAAPARASPRGRAQARSPGSSAAGSASGPGANFSAGVFGSRDAISAARCVELEGPHGVARVHDERPVADEPRGPRVARDLRPDRRRPRSSRGADLGLRAEARSSRDSSPSGSISDSLPDRAGRDLEELVRLGRQHRRVRGGHEPGRPRRRARRGSACGGVELREHVVEQQQRRDAATAGEHLGLGEQEREHREPLLALRAEAAQLAGRARDHDVVEVRAEPRRAALEVAVEPRCERGRARRLAVVGELRRRRARARRRARRTAGPSSSSTSRRAATSSAPSSAACSVHGASAARDGDARGDAPQRGVPLCDAAPYSAGSCARAGESRPSARSKYARRAAGAALDDAEPVGREDERRRLAAQLLGRAQRARR